MLKRRNIKIRKKRYLHARIVVEVVRGENVGVVGCERMQIPVAETKLPAGKPAAPTAVTGDSSHPTILWQCNL